MISFAELTLQWYLILASSSVIAIVSYLYANRNYDFWTKRGISGPKPLPVLGNMYSYFLRSMPDVELDWYRKYGKVFGIFVGNEPTLSIADPELVKQVMVKDFHLFRNRRPFPGNKKAEHNMFLARDDNWKRIRAIASPTFTSGKLKKMYSLINECCDDFMASLDEYAKNNKEIEVKKHHGAYTMDVIARCAFATKTNTHKDPNNEFTVNAMKIFDIKLWKVFVVSILPLFVMKVLGKYLVVRSGGEFFANVGRQLLKQRKLNNEKHNDFFQLLMDVERNDAVFAEKDELASTQEEIKANTNAFSNVIEKKLSEDEIISQCILFFAAGFETTATTLSFLTYELALHPEVQEKLFKEISAVLNGENTVSYETLMSLEYLDAVFSETLRKYPPLIRLERQAMKDVVLGDNRIVIPKEKVVEIPVYSMHYDPENFPNPNEFIPERFLPENSSNIKPYTYMPFGTGPRNCIGMRFALLEAKIALVHIINKFRIFRTPNTDIPLQMIKGKRLLAAKRILVGIERR